MSRNIFRRFYGCCCENSVQWLTLTACGPHVLVVAFYENVSGMVYRLEVTQEVTQDENSEIYEGESVTSPDVLTNKLINHYCNKHQSKLVKAESLFVCICRVPAAICNYVFWLGVRPPNLPVFLRVKEGQGPPSSTMCHRTPQVYLPNCI